LNKILLTGSSGFVGKNFISFVKEYDSDFYKRLLLLSSTKNRNVDTVVYRDFNNLPSLLNYDIEAVIHLGAYIPKCTAQANTIKNCNSNISFTQSLLEILPRTVKKFIFASTVDVYSNVEGILNENSPTVPESLYGFSKLYCEKMIQLQALKNSFIIQILRLGHLYGKWEDAYTRMIPEFIRRILSGKPPEITTKGKEKRSFLHISDCVKNIYQAYTLDNSLGVVNIVSEKSYDVKTIAKKLVKISGKKLDCSILNKNTCTRDFLFNNTKMKSFLCPEKMSIDEGLREEYSYFAANCR
jgi:UDP-glucose 4-epimerase